MKQTVTVENMTCGGCANTVKKRFEGVPGVKNVEIDLENKTATIESDERISHELLKESLEGTNYGLA